MLNNVSRTIKQLREEHKLTLKDMGIKTGLSPSYIADMESGRIQKISLEKIEIIADVFNLSLIDILIRSGYNNPFRLGVQNEIAADPHLSDKDKNILLFLYNSFKKEGEIAVD